MFIFHAPRGVAPALALDEALKRRADDRHDKRRGHDEEQRDLELRRELEHFLGQCLKDEDFAAAVDLLDQHLPPKRYGDQDRHEADDEERDEHPDHERLVREFAEKHHLSDDAVEELGELMPRPGIERLGGRAVEDRHADDRRRADDRHRRGADRRRMAGDESFYAMFPEARRIGVA
jgi:hypothetical protein